MKRTQAQSIGDIIRNVVKSQNLEDKLLEQRIIDSYPTIVGSVINNHTSYRFIKDHTLYINITSAPLKNELQLHRSRLIASLNNVAGKDVITEIIIR